jgi:hypothetical protein
MIVHPLISDVPESERPGSRRRKQAKFVGIINIEPWLTSVKEWRLKIGTADRATANTPLPAKIILPCILPLIKRLKDQ